MAPEDVAIDVRPGLGIAAEDVRGAFHDVQVQCPIGGSERPGLWAQDNLAASPTEPTLSIATVDASAGSGIVLRRLTRASLEGVTVRGTTPRTEVSAQLGTNPIGDGVSAIGLKGPLAIANSTLESNARVRLLLDRAEASGSSVACMALEIRVDACANAYGVSA